MQEQTMLSYLRDSLTGGELPAGFHLPAQTRQVFADGMADGVRRYHTAPRRLTEAEREAVCAFMESAAAGDEDKARALLQDLVTQKELPAYDFGQEILQWAQARTEPDLRDRLHCLGRTLIRQSGVHEREQVKTGLILLSLAGCTEDERADVRTLGLCDEFTLFVLPVMRTWPSAGDEMFLLAQKVHGLGRIHLAEEIRPESDAVRRWFLTDAVHNTVHPAYSALTCWRKGDAPAALLGPLSPEEFRGIRDIIGGLLDEGPVRGVSQLEDAEAAMFVFLVRAKEFEISAEDAAVIRAVRGRFSERREIASLCDELLESYREHKQDEPAGRTPPETVRKLRERWPGGVFRMKDGTEIVVDDSTPDEVLESVPAAMSENVLKQLGELKEQAPAAKPSPEEESSGAGSSAQERTPPEGESKEQAPAPKPSPEEESSGAGSPAQERTPPERTGKTAGPDRQPRFFDDDGSAVWLDGGNFQNEPAGAPSGRPVDPSKQHNAEAEAQIPFSSYDNQTDGQKPSYLQDETEKNDSPAPQVTELLPPRTLDELMARQPEERKHRSGAGTMLALSVLLLVFGAGTHHEPTVLCAALLAVLGVILWITKGIKKKKQ